eukprot:CAMPEP_0180150980 /NCGR_PEP_ID=MMETSP0986-20121125/21848_1 /TAXON_ID=697907 /ORGANISM="non described non described, Strain CCMP2293" /LENGTH=49 /DNA_ID= /DNA_START= /DNA_END= /DNA_ORIENTATION=
MAGLSDGLKSEGEKMRPDHSSDPARVKLPHPGVPTMPATREAIRSRNGS